MNALLLVLLALLCFVGALVLLVLGLPLLFVLMLVVVVLLAGIAFGIILLVIALFAVPITFGEWIARKVGLRKKW